MVSLFEDVGRRCAAESLICKWLGRKMKAVKGLGGRKINDQVLRVEKMNGMRDC
jgi:hypothetical protein